MRLFANSSLKAKAAAFIVATLVASIGIMMVSLTNTVVPQMEAAILASTGLIGDNLIKDVKKTVDLGVSLRDLDGLSQKLTEIVAQNPGLGFIYITDESGAPLFRREGTAQEAIDRGRAAAGSGATETSTTRITVGGQDYYNLAVPLASGDRIAGVVHLGLRGNVVTSQINPLILRLALIGIATFLVATTVIIFFVSRFISRPLHDLSGTAKQISGGNLVVPDVGGRRDEIGQLAIAFEIMVHGLTSMVERFRDTSSSLGASSGELAEVSRRLSGSFSLQTESMEKVAATIREMDQLSHDLYKQAQNLSNAAADSSSSILENTASISEITQNLSEISSSMENISAAIYETSTTIKQVASGAEDTASMAESTRDAIERINTGIKNMEEMAERSRSLSANLKSTAQDSGSRSVKETMTGIRSIHEDVQHAEKALQLLEERVGSIGEIIGVIDDIADQTNLLALNAAIISAQAGEEGRSFAVVAQEIRKLSASTSESTKKIAGLIEGAQEEARNYAGYLTRVSDSVDRGLSLGQEAEKALDRIIHSADESSRMANLIAENTRQQASASEEVSKNVHVFTLRAEETRKATSEEAKGTELIKMSMEKAKDMIEKVYRATEEQTRTGKLISETSERTRNIAGELFAATELEKQLAGAISSAVSDVKKMGQENSALVSLINTSSDLMTRIAGNLKEELGKYRTKGER
jgi:methyl-accepting chemotaxis protein